MRNLDEILADTYLALPIGAKTYRIKPIGYLDELRIKAATTQTAAAIQALADGEPPGEPAMSDDEFLALVLGDALAEMRADNLSSAVILRAAFTAHAYSTHGQEVAEQLWENGPSPEALAASVQAAAQGSTPSSSTDAADATPTPASTSGTKPRRTTPRANPKAKRSPGPTSSRKAT